MKPAILRFLVTLSLALALVTLTRGQDSDCNGTDVRCSDGHYHAPDGSIQPDICSTKEGETHTCECERATDCAAEGPNVEVHPGKQCQTFCRPKACTCRKHDCS